MDSRVMELPDFQIDTPEEFKAIIEKIKDEPLKHYPNFNNYISHLFSEIGCGVPYIARHTPLSFTGTRKWRFECCFGGRTRAKNPQHTKKKWNCKSYIEFSAINRNQNYYISFLKAEWKHTHLLSKTFLEANSILSDQCINKIKDMTQNGFSANDIRKVPEYASLPSKKFYRIRFKEMMKNQSCEIMNFINECKLYNDKFHIYHHWRFDQINDVKKYNGSTFISKSFIDVLISSDIVFMDDTCCINEFDFPLITITFQDFNETRQLLAFGFLPGREAKHFESFLNDVKKNIKNDIRVFIIDRWRGQLKAIKKVFPNCNIVFCRIHLERNIRSTFGKYSRIGSLFNQLLNGSIKPCVYLNELKKLIDQSSKHKKVLQTLYDDFQSYCPSYLSKLRLRGQYTTNSQEGFFGTFKSRYGHKRLLLIEILHGVVGMHQAGITNSMEKSPMKFKETICKSPPLGSMAFTILKNELNKTSTLISLLTSNDTYEIERGRYLANNCNCSIKWEYGLPCSHDFFEQFKELKSPIISNELIPDIYYFQQFGSNFLTENTNIDDDPDDDVDYSFPSLMEKFSKVSSKALRNKNIQNNIKSFFNNIKQWQSDEGPEPLTLKHKGRKKSRPALRNTGAKKRKRSYTCKNCGQPGHNSQTCKSGKSKSLDKKTENYNQKEFDESSGQNTNVNESDFIGFDYSDHPENNDDSEKEFFEFDESYNSENEHDYNSDKSNADYKSSESYSENESDADYKSSDSYSENGSDTDYKSSDSYSENESDTDYKSSERYNENESDADYKSSERYSENESDTNYKSSLNYNENYSFTNYNYGENSDKNSVSSENDDYFKEISENEDNYQSFKCQKQQIETYEKLLSKEQLEIINICPNFKNFLHEITTQKDATDRPTINGIYLSQYQSIFRYAKFYSNRKDSPEVFAIKLIYQMNFNQMISDDLIPDILEMVKCWGKNDAFESNMFED